MMGLSSASLTLNQPSSKGGGKAHAVDIAEDTTTGLAHAVDL